MNMIGLVVLLSVVDVFSLGYSGKVLAFNVIRLVLELVLQIG